MLVVAEQWMIGSFRPALAVALGRMGQVILTLVFVARRLALCSSHGFRTLTLNFPQGSSNPGLFICLGKVELGA